MRYSFFSVCKHIFFSWCFNSKTILKWLKFSYKNYNIFNILDQTKVSKVVNLESLGSLQIKTTLFLNKFFFVGEGNPFINFFLCEFL